MSPIGNDIVALLQPANRSAPLRSGFQQKVFTASEQAWIRDQLDLITAVWCLWAFKEAAYKVGIKLGDPHSFRPRSLEVCPETDTRHKMRAEVYCANRVVKGVCTINDDFIHAIASTGLESHLYSAIVLKVIEEESASTKVRFKLATLMAERFGVAPEDVSVQKGPDNIPQLYCGIEPLPVDLSISHDGAWGAFAYHEHSQ